MRLHVALLLMSILLKGPRAVESLLLGRTFCRKLSLPQMSYAADFAASAGLNEMKKKVIIVAGATSVGKSAVVAELCKHISAEVILADSVQIYKHLDIGSNKPSKEEQDSVPHHMVSLREPHETFSCGDFVRAAAPIIFDILDRGKTPVVVGGSTMWIQWLVHGMPDAPKADAEVAKQADDMLQGFIANDDWTGASAFVSAYDRPRVEKLGKNDWYRLRRYLEVALSVLKQQQQQQGLTTGIDNSLLPSAIGNTEQSSSTSSTERTNWPSSEVEESSYDEEQQQGGEGESVVTGKRTSVLPGIDIRGFFVTEERDQLYHYIDTRCESMLKAGLFQEVTQLLTNDLLTPDSIAARAIGYRQTIDYLCRPEWKQFEVKAFDNYVRQFATATRNYAKRQLQWYRKDDAFLWLKIDRSSSGIYDPVPYYKVCEELQYWVDTPQSQFKEAVKQQMLRGLAVTAAKNRKNHGHRNVTRDEYDILALQAVAAEKARDAMAAAESITKQEQQQKRQGKKGGGGKQQWQHNYPNSTNNDQASAAAVATSSSSSSSSSSSTVTAAVASGSVLARESVVPFNFRSTVRFSVDGPATRASLSLASLPMSKNSMVSRSSNSSSSSGVSPSTTAAYSHAADTAVAEGGVEGVREREVGDSVASDADESRSVKKAKIDSVTAVVEVKIDGDFKIDCQGRADKDAVITTSGGDIDPLPQPLYKSAEVIAIRAAEGVKKTALRTYQNNIKTDDIGQGRGSVFDELLVLADRCAVELREKHPALVEEFAAFSKSESAKKAAAAAGNAVTGVNAGAVATVSSPLPLLAQQEE